MTILDGEKLREFWDNLAEGFNRSPLEIILWLTLLFLLIILPIFIFIIYSIGRRRREIKRARNRFYELQDKKGLSAEEKQQLKTMSQFFIRNKKHLPQLITHGPTFTACARRMIDKSLISDQELASLRIKLGLGKNKPFGQLHSTAELVPGIVVKLSLPQAGQLKGKIQEVVKDGFFISTKAHAAIKQPIVLEIDIQAGCFLVHSHILECEDGLLKVAHSEHIERIQNRDYFRKNLRLPVHIKLPGIAEKSFSTSLLDLGGGGARIHNPDLPLHMGQEIILFLSLPDKERLLLQARITRVSESDSSICIQFNSIREATRDKIMRVVLH